LQNRQKAFPVILVTDGHQAASGRCLVISRVAAQ